MARNLSMKDAINEAIDLEMTRDPSVILMGEDIAGGSGGQGEMDAWGGPLGVTKGLWSKHKERVMDTPLSESAFIGAAIGAGVMMAGVGVVSRRLKFSGDTSIGLLFVGMLALGVMIQSGLGEQIHYRTTGAGLGVVRAEDHTCQPRMHHRTGTHNTRLERHVHGAAG